MESSEFDKIIQGKLQEKHDLHQQEIEASKPFVWAAIPSNKTIVIPWYYLAAAALLFFICASFLFFNLQQQHRSELNFLAEKVEHLKNKTTSFEIIARKNQELDLLCSEVKALEYSLAEKKMNATPKVIPKQIVYQTDTIFITQTKYITEYLPSSQQESKETPVIAQILETENKVKTQAVSDLIYPDFNPSNNTESKKENASVKVKISTFSSN